VRRPVRRPRRRAGRGPPGPTSPQKRWSSRSVNRSGSPAVTAFATYRPSPPQSMPRPRSASQLPSVGSRSAGRRPGPLPTSQACPASARTTRSGPWSVNGNFALSSWGAAEPYDQCSERCPRYSAWARMTRSHAARWVSRNAGSMMSPLHALARKPYPARGSGPPVDSRCCSGSGSPPTQPPAKSRSLMRPDGLTRV